MDEEWDKRKNRTVVIHFFPINEYTHKILSKVLPDVQIGIQELQKAIVNENR